MAQSKRTIWEELGYDKFESKPTYSSYSLVKTKAGWVVLEVKMQGLQVQDVTIACQPTVRAHAVERLKILTVKALTEQ